ncbi:immunoglobulin-like domain-containing protein [Paenisporosarcina cavernae]|uniref:Bacterial Ig-like domain-containing protein n=1 Tax=Paenisporosarcina cavernae TaxID=2320858 RepID=A0A385YU67_9BACL|nr:immunoglobulin-like domain-containing protein [Paenisporosarcina cavernae]AYC30094.1 hypothetical protein D3873_09490 [Paenisporosarcina cavernae]
MKRYCYLSIVIVLLLLTSCSQETRLDSSEEKISPHNTDTGISNHLTDPTTDIHIYPDKEVYTTPIENVSLIIENNGQEAVVFGNGMYVERNENGTWYEIPYASFEFGDVTGEIRSKEKIGEEVPVANLKSKLTPGTYRIVKSFFIDSNQTFLATEFEVE